MMNVTGAISITGSRLAECGSAECGMRKWGNAGIFAGIDFAFFASQLSEMETHGGWCAFLLRFRESRAWVSITAVQSVPGHVNASDEKNSEEA
jgi:hypothetical protein